MIRLLADENFNGEIVNGVRRRTMELDLVRVQDVGLGGADDLAVLAWAAANNRIILTHDMRTFSRFAYQRVHEGLPMPGVFTLKDRIAVGLAIDEIILIIQCSDAHEWEGRVQHLPL